MRPVPPASGPSYPPGGYAVSSGFPVLSGTVPPRTPLPLRKIRNGRGAEEISPISKPPVRGVRGVRLSKNPGDTVRYSVPPPFEAPAWLEIDRNIT